MRLLSPQQAESLHKAEEAKLASRGMKVAKAVDAVTKKLNQLNEDYKNRQQELKVEFEIYQEGIERKRAELASGLEQLEHRRKEALKPIKEERVQLEKARELSEQLLQDVQGETEHCNELLEELRKQKLDLERKNSELTKKTLNLEAEEARFDRKVEEAENFIMLRDNEVAMGFQVLDSDRAKFVNEVVMNRELLASATAKLMAATQKEEELAQERLALNSERAELDDMYRLLKKQNG